MQRVSAEPWRSKLETLPTASGVYLFRAPGGEVLYVGKALSLRSRVRSYFQAQTNDTRAFIARLSVELGDIETIVVGSEKEAALLENQLIKEHQPRYNIKLRDDKEFLSLRLDPKAAWPRLEVVRRPQADGASYFGPYHAASAARQTLRLVNRHFHLRTCTDSEFSARKRPCLQFQIRRCPAPCVLEVDREAYGDQVRTVGLFLDGRHDELVAELQNRMTAAAAGLAFEEAATYRDQLRAIERVRETQRVASVSALDQDVIGLFRQADQAETAVLLLRHGKLVGVRTFPLSDVTLPDDELLASFVGEYYGRGTFMPDEVLLPMAVEVMTGLAELLSEEHGRRVTVLSPQRGKRRELVLLANENAQHAFEEQARAREDVEARLMQLKDRLRLPALPRRIECVDVSHTGGQDTVAAIVALKDCAPDRARYRTYRVRGVDGGDDYGAMYEVLVRRFGRGKKAEVGWELPQLLVVDGGKGQLNVALAAMRDQGIDSLAVVALAKEKENVLGDKLVERLYLPGQKNPIGLRETSPALQVLALARDEAHRASNLHRVKLGKRRHLRSDLEDIPGVGKRTRSLLLRKLGSLRAIRGADEQTLIAAGATRKQAAAITRALGPAAGAVQASNAREGDPQAGGGQTPQRWTEDAPAADEGKLRGLLDSTNGTPAGMDDAQRDIDEDVAIDNAFASDRGDDERGNHVRGGDGRRR